MSRRTFHDWFKGRTIVRTRPGTGGGKIAQQHRRPLRFEPLEDRRLLTITVNTLVDENDGIGVGGISLRDAIAAAPVNEIINFNPALFGNGPGTISLTHHELVINKPLSISGPGASLLTIDVSASDPTPEQNNGDGGRVFRIDDGNNGNLAIGTITGLTITGGDTAGDGGGIYCHENFAVADCIVTGNAADDGGGIYLRSGYMTLTRVTVSDNHAIDDGGGIANGLGRVTLQDSTVSGNVAADAGGGIANFGDLTGQHNLTVRNSTVSGNTATGFGGGIFNFAGISTVEFSTITNNSTPGGQGGGVATWGDSNTTRTDVRSSIIAGNQTNDVAHLTGAPSPANTFNSLGYNLIGTGTSLAKFNQTGDQTNVTNPRLGPLGDYGGSTQTHPLANGSPAIDAGNPTAFAGVNGVPLNDQRGISRILDGNGDATDRLDIGSFETNALYFLVDQIADENDGNYATGDLSLREAIALANASDSADGIFFSSALSGQTILLSLGELTITDDLTIDASSLAAEILIDATPGDNTPNADDGHGKRVFVVDDGETAYIKDVTLRGLSITGADYDNGGGGIFNNERLTVDDCTISGNAAQWGGGIYNQGYGDLTVLRSTITGNSAIVNTVGGVGSGGGFYNNGGTVLVEDSVISANHSVSYGGGVQNAVDGQFTVHRSTISNNIADEKGGGVHNGDGDVTVTDSTISGNQAVKGGGFFIVTPFLQETTIRNSTISGNVAPDGGGGLYNVSGTVQIEFSTITQNVSNDFVGSGVASAAFAAFAPTSFYGSLIVENFDPTAGPQAAPYDVAVNGSENSLTSRGYNIVGIGGFVDDTFNQPGDQVIGTADPLLGPLADNGGPTLTHALLPGSPAIDAGDPAAVAGVGTPVFDQRGPGFSRVRDFTSAPGSAFDVGAFEIQAAGPALPGDYNLNEVVDAADYTLWRNTLGQTVTPFTGADGDGDGKIDDDDYTVWKANFGNSLDGPGSGGAAEQFALSGGASDTGDIVVTTLDDVVDLADGKTSLREAIFAANIVAGPNTIEFDPALTASGPAAILLTLGQLDITDAVTIAGPGAELLTIDASGNDPNPEVFGDGSRIFNINDGNSNAAIEVSILGLTLTGGDTLQGGAIFSREQLSLAGLTISGNQATAGGAVALLAFGTESTIEDCTIVGNKANSQGGAIFVQASGSGTLLLHDNAISGNSANRGGTLYVGPSAQGAVVIVSDSDLFENSAVQQGGAIYLGSATAALTTIRNSHISGNTSGQQGGGVFVNAARDVSIVDCVIENNKSVSTEASTGRGGGVYSTTGDVAISGSTISGNKALSGGGVYSRNGELTINFSTIVNNTATEGNGGGIFSQSDRFTLLGSTISGNAANGVNTTVGRGGGLFLMPALQIPTTILDNAFVENSAANYGGGIYLRPASNDYPGAGITLTNATISHNHAKRGGGLAGGAGTVGGALGALNLNGGVIAENTAIASGGGMYLRLSNINIIGTTISGNLSGGNGGGIAVPSPGANQLNLTGVTLSGNAAGADGLGGEGVGDGGALWLAGNSSVVRMLDSHVTANSARRGGGIARVAQSGFGGVTAIDSTISGNTAEDKGGGVYSLSGVLSLTGCQISGNTSAGANNGHGGGIFARTVDVSLVNSTLSGNSALNARGGGLYLSQAGDLVVLGSTVSGNFALQDGGGIVARTTSRDATTIISSTISGNSSQRTGGIYLSGIASIRNTTITANTGGANGAGGLFAGDGTQQLELDSVILAGNTNSVAGASPDFRTFLPANRVTMRYSLLGTNSGTNLVEAPLGSPDASGNLIGKPTESGGQGVIDPRLGPLAANGGRTFTHALLPGSPALDAGALITGPPQGYDQRGNPFSRTVDGTSDGVVRIDIGAYESQGAPSFSPGDYNRDGGVDACDYTIWRITLGEKPVTPFSGADGNGDGTINEADYEVWKSHFGDGLVFNLGGAGALSLASEPNVAALPGLPFEYATEPPALPGVSTRSSAFQRSAASATHSDDALIAWLAAQPREVAAPHDSYAPACDSSGDDDSQSVEAALAVAFESFGA